MYFNGSDILTFIGVCIGAFAIVVAATIPFLFSIRKHTKAASSNSEQTRNEVMNDHKINLRDDLDQKFKGLYDRMGKLETNQVDSMNKIDLLERTVPRIRRRLF